MKQTKITTTKTLAAVYIILVLIFSILYPEQSLCKEKEILLGWRIAILIPLLIISYNMNIIKKIKYVIITGITLCGMADLIMGYNFVIGFAMFLMFNLCMLHNLKFKAIDMRKRYLLIFPIAILIWYTIFFGAIPGVLKYIVLFYLLILMTNIYLSFSQKTDKANYAVTASILFFIGDLQVANDLWLIRLPNSSLINNLIYYSSLLLYIIYYEKTFHCGEKSKQNV